MNLSEVSVNRPVTVAIITVLLLGVAAFMIPNLAVELTPDVDPPVALVYTELDGASPQEMEQSVTELLEKQLSNVSGLDELTSTSSEETSMVILEFDWDIDMDEATTDIRDSLDQIKNSLPDDATTPIIMKFDRNSEPIMTLIMRGDESADTLKRLAEDVVQPRLERVAGVASADVTGGETRAVRVDLSKERLEAYGITASTVTTALSARNLQISGGSIDTDGMEYDLRIDERYGSVEEIARTVVDTVETSSTITSVNRSNVVRLEDVADVYEGIEDKDSIYYIDGKQAISISVSRESDSNSVSIAKEVKEEIKAINDELPKGVTVELYYDDTEYISSVMSQVYNSAWQGIVLAMLVLFLFLRNIRSTIIIGISIPVSIVITLMAMYFFGITLNMMSLTGLILGLGMIVDNSIVILENIYQYRERGAKLRPAAILGSHEMFTSIVASTLTTLGVFVPMIIWKDGLEMIGQMFSDMIFTVVISLIVSFLTAILLVPALCSRLIKIYTHVQRPIKNRVIKSMYNFGERILTGLENLYKKVLTFSLANRLLVITLVVVIFIMSALKITSMGLSMFPSSESDDQVSVDFTLPVGTTMDYTEKIMSAFVDVIEDEISGYTHISMSVGGGNAMSSSGDNEGTVEISLPDVTEQTTSAADIEKVLRKHLNDFPDTEITIDSGMTFGSDSPIDVVVYSDNIDLAEETADEIKDLIKENIPQAVDPVTDLDEGQPEYQIVIDKDKAAAYGLTVSTIGNAINYLVDGTTPTSYWDDADELDVIVQLSEDERTELQDLDSMFIVASDGTNVPLSNLVSYEEGTGPLSISRENETRTVHVTADLEEGFASNQIQPMIESLLNEKLILPDGVSYEFSGDRQSIAEMVPTLLTVAIVALMMIFAIMASQFESLVDPFIIFFSIPLLLIGVVAVYVITGSTLSLFSIIGMVVLVGIVVNNGIVMVDYMNLLRKRGSTVYDSIIEGAKSRLRPVLMTSLTTILGMVPMAFFPGAGGDLISPIGKTIVGGLSGSTLITLVITPVVYSLVNGRKDKKKKNNNERRVIEEQTA
ncbi:MAG: efflux RND transporter permease subunit [Spirochaetales bacterium]|nr:efflux RND transporter permease subunit [Spirochaetales bacterium]